jgi:hypothetical protein
MMPGERDRIRRRFRGLDTQGDFRRMDTEERGRRERAWPGHSGFALRGFAQQIPGAGDMVLLRPQVANGEAEHEPARKSGV